MRSLSCKASTDDLMLLAGGKDIDIKTDGSLVLVHNLVKHVFYQPGFPDSSSGNQCDIPAVLHAGNDCLCLFSAVTEIVGALVTLVNKGVLLLLSHIFSLLSSRKFRNEKFVTNNS